MLRVIKDLLYQVIKDIDAGNSNISEEEALQIIDYLKELSYKDKRLSKYESYRYLNVSRATFDNYVREGKLPRGKHEAGFKELSWSKKDLDNFIKEVHNERNK
jgi:predicted DNA-binding transcriptional regulator AlpA